MAKLIEKFQEGKKFKYHYQNGDGVWFGTNSNARMEELRNSGKYIPAEYDWETREWVGRHDLNPVQITADRPTVLRDDRGMEWDHEGRDIINEAARSYRYNAYPNMSTYYDSRYFQNNRVPSARVGDVKGNRYVESQAPAVSDYYQVLLKQYPQLSGALKRRGWTPAQFSQYAMSGGFERDPKEQENLDRANREVHSERRQKEEKFLKDVQERPNYKGLNYLMIGAAAFPALPILSESGLLSPVVNTGKDMLMHPTRTALGFAGADIGGGAVDKTIQRTTGDENFGAWMGRITGTPELSGMWQFGNPGYFLGGFAGDMTHKIVRDGVNRFAPTVMSNMDNMFGNMFGLRPAYATAGGVSADATESSIQMMGRKRNKGGNKSGKPKERPATTSEELPPPESTSGEIPPVEEAPEPVREKPATEGKPVEREPEPEVLSEEPVTEGKPATEEKPETSEVSFQQYLDNLRAKTPNSNFRRKNANKFIKAHTRMAENNYGGKKATGNRMKDQLTMEDYINGGESGDMFSPTKTKSPEEWKKAVDQALKDAVKYEEERATHNKKIMRWAIPTGVATVGIPSFFFLGNKATTNDNKDNNNRDDVAVPENNNGGSENNNDGTEVITDTLHINDESIPEEILYGGE